MESFLLNIEAHARNTVVLVIGTHLDCVTSKLRANMIGYRSYRTCVNYRRLC